LHEAGDIAGGAGLYTAERLIHDRDIVDACQRGLGTSATSAGRERRRRIEVAAAGKGAKQEQRHGTDAYPSFTLASLQAVKAQEKESRYGKDKGVPGIEC
jgi:hypothetical protein